MPKALKPMECLKRMLDSKVQINKDKWNAGLDNQYTEWENLRDDVFYALEGYYNTSRTNSELRNRVMQLERQVELLKKEKEELQKKYDDLAYIMDEPNDDEEGWNF